MTLYTELSDIPADFGPSVVTIGNFDGVHIGHTRVISRVVEDGWGARAGLCCGLIRPAPNAGSPP